MSASGTLLDRLTGWLADYLSRPIKGFEPPAAYSADQLGAVLQPGDVLLVEGNLRISSIIKYITQSTWSHVALYVGPQPGAQGNDPPVLIEAEMAEGVILSPLSKYANSHTRICRAIGLRPDDCARVVAHALGRIGHAYDLKHVIDLARHRLSPRAVAETLKRGLRALGSGLPTRAICSSLIAEAFQSVRYPILPRVGWYRVAKRQRTALTIASRRPGKHAISACLPRATSMSRPTLPSSSRPRSKTSITRGCNGRIERGLTAIDRKIHRSNSSSSTSTAFCSTGSRFVSV